MTGSAGPAPLWSEPHTGVHSCRVAKPHEGQPPEWALPLDTSELRVDGQRVCVGSRIPNSESPPSLKLRRTRRVSSPESRAPSPESRAPSPESRAPQIRFDD